MGQGQQGAQAPGPVEQQPVQPVGGGGGEETGQVEAPYESPTAGQPDQSLAGGTERPARRPVPTTDARLKAEFENDNPANDEHFKDEWTEKAIRAYSDNLAQLDAEFRARVKPVEHAGPADTQLYALPGKTKEVAALAEKMAKLAKQKFSPPNFAEKGGVTVPKPRTTPKPAKSDLERVSAVSGAASTSGDNRYAFNGVYYDGPAIVATDGRRLFAITKNDPKSSWGPKKKGVFEVGPKGLQGAPIEGTFPPYKDIIPSTKGIEPTTTIKLDETIRRLRQIEALVSERTKGVLWAVNKDGSLAFATVDPEFGQGEVNYRPGAKELGAINPEFLREALEFHVKTSGDNYVSMYWQKPNRPVLLEQKTGQHLVQSVTMPVNSEGEAAADVHAKLQGGNEGTLAAEANKLAANPDVGGTLNLPPKANPARAVVADDPAASKEPGDKGSPLGGPIERVKNAWHSLVDGAKEFGGALYPRTTRVSPKSGEALAELIASPVYAREAAPVIAAEVLGTERWGPFRRPIKDLDVKAGAALVEDNLRSIAQQLADEGDLEGAVKVTGIVGGEGSPFKTEADFQAAIRDPEVKAVVDRYKKWFSGEPEQNYRASQGFAPEHELPSRGQRTGARVNLIAVKEGEAPKGSVVYAARRGNLQNPIRKPSPFARKAYGSGQAYDVRLSKMIENTLKKGTWNANLHRLYDVLQSEGAAVKGKGGAHPMIGNRATKELKIDVGGQVQYLHVRDDVYGEVRRALNVDQGPESGILRTLASTANHISLVGFGEGLTHIANSIGPLIRAPGGFFNLARWMKRSVDVALKSPEAMNAMVGLAKIAAIKPTMDAKPWEKFTPTHYLGRIIDVVTRGARLAMNDAFNSAVERGLVEDTPTARRDFTNQLGQYMKQGQSWMIRWARDTGFGPFVTAGSNYFAQGVKFMGVNPGVKGRTPYAAARLRLTVMGSIVAALAAVALWNWLKRRDVTGGKSIPFGAIRLDDSEDGKPRYLDLLAILGVTRGLRNTGALAAIEAKRHGLTKGETADRAVKDVTGGLIRPFAGPLVEAAAIAKTGRTVEGHQLARLAAPGQSQNTENLKAAAKSLNPFAKLAAGEKAPQFGPFSVRSAPHADESAAMELLRRRGTERAGGAALTEAQIEKMDLHEQLAAAVRKDREAGRQQVVAALKEGKLTPAEAMATMKRGLATEIQYRILHADARDAMEAWKVMTPQEQQETRGEIVRKIISPQSELKPEEKRQYIELLRPAAKPVGAQG
jgi:hypothetical protein